MRKYTLLSEFRQTESLCFSSNNNGGVMFRTIQNNYTALAFIGLCLTCEYHEHDVIQISI